MKVMIVDDHAGVRNMIRQLLHVPGYTFVECATGEAAVQAARDFKPDYVTMDVRLPGLSGLEAARVIRTIHPASRLIIVTCYDQPFLRETANELGAVAYVLKYNLADLRSVLVGGVPPFRSGSVSGQMPESTPSSEPANPDSQCSSSSAPTEPFVDAGQKPAPRRDDNPLRVLVIEDSQYDFELIIRQLRRCGFAPRARRVDSGPELRLALEQDPWDIIITDRKLPTFSGAEALALIRDIGLNIPTLCVTGSADPAKNSEVLDAGACALVSKDDLAPLCAAVTDALNRRAAQSDRPGDVIRAGANKFSATAKFD